MANLPLIDPVLYLDASYAIAVSSARDKWHERAMEIGRLSLASRTKLVTSTAVLAEIANSLAKLKFRSAAVTLLDWFAADPLVEIVPFDQDLYAQAAMLYKARPDKEWGLTDCASFVIMRERGIGQALTSDEHFGQAGFVALLR